MPSTTETIASKLPHETVVEMIKTTYGNLDEDYRRICMLARWIQRTIFPAGHAELIVAINLHWRSGGSDYAELVDSVVAYLQAQKEMLENGPPTAEQKLAALQEVVDTAIALDDHSLGAHSDEMSKLTGWVIGIQGCKTAVELREFMEEFTRDDDKE